MNVPSGEKPSSNTFCAGSAVTILPEYASMTVTLMRGSNQYRGVAIKQRGEESKLKGNAYFSGNAHARKRPQGE